MINLTDYARWEYLIDGRFPKPLGNGATRCLIGRGNLPYSYTRPDIFGEFSRIKCANLLGANLTIGMALISG